jgi:hypothetical protein
MRYASNGELLCDQGYTAEWEAFTVFLLPLPRQSLCVATHSASELSSLQAAHRSQ